MDDQIRHYEEKLSHETDSWDLNEAIHNGENIIAIDARSTEAFTEEHIPGAMSLPHRTMNQETTSHLDRESLYVTYCDGIGCNASTKGARNMARLGFRVKELIGGLDWWKRDGYPTETSDKFDQPKSYSLDEIRRDHPKAYEKWSFEDDEELKKKYSMGLDTSELAKLFKRQPSAILSRLTKLGLK